MRGKRKDPNVSDLLTENVIRKLAWRATLRARTLRADARTLWQDASAKKKINDLKFRASQFDDLATMLSELLEPEEPTSINLKLGEKPDAAEDDS